MAYLGHARTHAVGTAWEQKFGVHNTSGPSAQGVIYGQASIEEGMTLFLHYSTTTKITTTKLEYPSYPSNGASIVRTRIDYGF